MLQELDAYANQLNTIRNLIAANDGERLAALFEHARDARTAWAEAHQNKTAEARPGKSTEAKSIK